MIDASACTFSGDRKHGDGELGDLLGTQYLECSGDLENVELGHQVVWRTVVVSVKRAWWERGGWSSVR